MELSPHLSMDTLAHLEDLLARSHQGVLILGEKGEIVHASAFAQKLLDVTFTDGIGRIRAVLMDMDGKTASTLAELGDPPALFRMRIGSEPERILKVVSRTSGAVLVQDMAHEIEHNTAEREFLDVVAHDLRAGLVPVKTYAQMLYSGILGEVTPKQFDALKAIDHCVERQADKIANVLDMIKTEDKKLQLAIDAANLNDVVQRCVEGHERDSKRRNLQVSYTTEGSAAVMADMPRMQRVLNTLLGRCIRDAAQGSRIGVEVQNFGPLVRVRLWDNGSGVNAADLKILRQSAREQALDRMASGTRPNIDLAPIHDIMALHGGRIEVQTTENAGTTYLLYLPAAKKNPVPAIASPRRALLVCGDSHETGVLRAALGNQGIEITAVPGVLEAVKASREQYCPLLFVSDAGGHPHIETVPDAVRGQRPDEPLAVAMIQRTATTPAAGTWSIQGDQLESRLSAVLPEMIAGARLKPAASGTNPA